MIELTCGACGKKWNVQENTLTTLMCASCGSATINFPALFDLICPKGHAFTSETYQMNCPECRVGETTGPVYKLLYVETNLDYIKLQRKSDLESFIEKEGLNVTVSKSDRLADIKIKISQALIEREGNPVYEEKKEEIEEEEKVKIKTRKRKTRR